MARKLDHQKPYGTVCGATGGAAFEQDGLLFDSHGNELVTEAKPVKEAKAKPVKEAKAKPAAEAADETSTDQQVAAFLGEDQGGMAS